MNSKTKYLLLALGTTLFCVVVWYFISLISYILIAVFLSFVGRPLMDSLNKIKIGKRNLPVSLNAAITLIALLGFVLTFIRIFIPLVAGQLQELAKIDIGQIMLSMTEPIQRLELMAHKFNLAPKDKTLEQFVTEKLVAVINPDLVSRIINSLVGAVGNIFVAIFAISFMTFFFLKDERLFVNSVVLITPERYEEKVKAVLSSIKKLLMRYFLGIVIESTIMITLITIGLMIVGLKFEHALTVGFIMGSLNVIPYVGPIIGCTMGLVIGITSNIGLPFYEELVPLLIYMLIVIVTVQVIDATVFQPFIYSNSVNAHPLEIFMVIMIAGSLAGVLGMFLAIPSYTILRVIAKEFFNNFKVVKKLTENI